ncbi:PepSY-associated TM helix domain-containing protein [Phenylobacterium sp.]|uniref:PepSY-associated TM helix domain-containing protein n=1 Tax=Phenylobacterium sp. TaxID=1871053 RepID=UPI002FC8F83B
MVPKRLLLQIHRWSGLAAALLILLQAGTGALLVFRTGLAELVDPAGMIRRSAAGAAPLSRVFDAARARYPGYGVDKIVFPQTGQGVYLVHLLDPRGASRYVSVDPGTADVSRAGEIWAFPAEAILQVHYRLLTGRPGLALMMLSGLALLVMAATGLSYWWPKRGRLKKSLMVDTRLPGKVVLRQVHRTLGVACAASAVFSATTGLVVAGEFILAPGPLVPFTASAEPVRGDLDMALAQARTAYPGRSIRDVRLRQADALDVFFWAPEASPHAVHRVRVDLAGARVLEVTPATRAGTLWMTLLPIHSGDMFGRLGSLVILFGALGLVTLAATGPIVWLLSRRRQ